MAKKHKHKDAPAAPVERAPIIPGRVRAWLPLGGLLVLVTVMRFNMVLWQPLIFPDSLQYMHLAQEIRSGVFFQKDYDLDRGFIKSRRIPPFYSLLMAPFAGTADLETVGHLISIFLSIFTLVPVYFITASIFSRREAFIVGLLLAFHSMINKFGAPVLTESTFTAIYLSVVWASLEGMRRGSWRLLLAAGVLSALAYMTRDVGITAFAVAAAGSAAWSRLVDRRPGRQTAGLAAAVLAGFFIVSAPYFVHIRARTGHWGLSVQMSTTSITDQVRLFGGDRFDRDRLTLEEKRTRMVGGDVGTGPLALLRAAPALAVKVMRNAFGYVSEAMVKAESLLLLFFLAGLFAVGVGFYRGRDRRRLFERLWPAVWVFQLLLLYALVTPYMVDIRYMYPVLPLVMALAARGITFTAEEVQPGKARPVWPVAVAAALFAAYIVFYPRWTDGEALAKLEMIFGQRMAPFRYTMTPLAVGIVFGAVLLGLLSAGPLRAVSRWTAGSRILIGAVIFAAGAALVLALAFNGLRLAQVASAALLAGPGVALILSGLSARGPRPLWLTGALTAGLLLFFTPDTIYQWNWFTDTELAGKYASGYKEAAAEIKALKLVPPGALICSRKPFIAYYLDGYWYLDSENEPIPKLDQGLMELIRQRKIDYLALDTFTLKNLRPALVERSLALEPIPGAALIYGRYFPVYNRVITVYDCRRDDPGPPRRASAAEYVAAARQYYSQDQLPFALRELQAGLNLDPKNSEAWFLTGRILTIYYDCGARGDVPSLAMMPRILPAIVKAAKNYSILNPNDPEASAAAMHAEQIYAEERAEVERMQPGTAGGNND